MPVIVNRYAKALVDVSIKLGQHEQVTQELAQFESLLINQRELRLFYSNPAIPIPRKREATAEILKKLSFCQTTSNFIFVLIDKHRVGYFSEIRKAFQSGLNDRLGIVQAEITTAVDLDDEIRERLEARLAIFTGKMVTLRFLKNPDLIAGVVTRIGDTIYDGSIRQQLNSMKARLSSD